MTRPPRNFGTDSRAVESIHSGLLLFGYALVLAMFMAAVILINGA
ncbi:hypothetical protein [Halostagnicola larsenii]|nr:hypothetical protein [Halostagnicola larsenii]